MRYGGQKVEAVRDHGGGNCPMRQEHATEEDKRLSVSTASAATAARYGQSLVGHLHQCFCSRLFPLLFALFAIRYST